MIEVRGFHGTPVVKPNDKTVGRTPGSTTPHQPQRGRLTNCVVDDIVSANCSPVLPPISSPAMSGIGLLRQQLEPFNLDSSASSRANSLTQNRGRAPVPAFSPLSRDVSLHGLHTRSSSPLSGWNSDTSVSDRTTTYEVNLEHDFVDESVRSRAGDRKATADVTSAPNTPSAKPTAPPKVTAADFETLRCLGKGTYGTVILVKQRSTGRLYAQKQFKKASLVVHKKLVEQTKTERQILESVNCHPFVVKLFYAFQDQEKLYLILEYGQGGELFTHLNTEKMFSEDVAAFYLAEMVLALSHLHDTLGVIYRDLKPENCLLDADGHLLLTDFGLSKVAADEADTCNSMLGTVEYMAPEVVQGRAYGKAVDWWSFGALGYDLLTGNPPFRGANNKKIMEAILKQKLVLPYFMSADAKDILTRLLRKEPQKRLGAHMPRDLATIKKHRFFRKIDWKKLALRQVTPPIKPLITDLELAENFSTEFTQLRLSSMAASVLSPADPSSPIMGRGGAGDDPFGGFSFVASSSFLEGGAFQIPSGLA